MSQDNSNYQANLEQQIEQAESKRQELANEFKNENNLGAELNTVAEMQRVAREEARLKEQQQEQSYGFGV